MRLGMMLNDGESRTGGDDTFTTYYKQPGGINLPYFRTKPLIEQDVFISRIDPVTGEVYETGPRSADEIPAPEPRGGLQYRLCPDGVNVFPDCPDSAPPNTIQPKPPVAVADPPPTTDGTVHTMSPSQDSAQSLTKPLLIAGAIVAGLFLLKD